MFEGACSCGDGGTEGLIAVAQCGLHNYLRGFSLHGGKLFGLHKTETGYREGREGNGGRKGEKEGERERKGEKEREKERKREREG